jgi:hypothetical protein
MVKPAKPKYRGVLAEPMAENADITQVARRIAALFEHYGIPIDTQGNPDTRWLELVLALSKAHVPGFRTKQHRPLFTQVAVRDLMLIGEIDKRVERGLSVKRAAELVVKARPNLGFKSAGAARVRFEQLTHKDAPDRGNARKGMLALMWYLNNRTMLNRWFLAEALLNSRTEL